MVSTKQSIEWFPEYLKEADWAVLADPDAPWARVVSTLVQRLVSLGVKSLTETSYRSIYCTIAVARAGRKFPKSDKAAALAGIDKLKEHLPRQIAGYAHSDAGRIRVYPRDVEQLKTENPKIWERAYSDEPPSMKINMGHFHTFLSMTPCRDRCTDSDKAVGVASNSLRRSLGKRMRAIGFGSGESQVMQNVLTSCCLC